MSLEVRDMNVTRGAKKTLADVSLSLAGGGVTAVVGPNGAGKSTFLSALAGLLPHDGAVTWKGEAVDRRALAYMPQNTDVRSALTVLEVMLLGRLERLGVRVGDDDIADAMALLSRFGLADLASRAMPTLSGGQRQLVMLSQRLMRRPEVLIMDEPTSALTEGEVERLFRVIGRLRARGVTILYISHKMDEVFGNADAVTVLRDGGHVVTLPRAEVTPKQVTHLMVGREIEATHVGGGRTPGDVVLSVEGLSLPNPPGHARPWRLKDVSFSLRRGEVFGIAGLMGAGRTELMESLFGVGPQRPVGRVTLDGRAVRFRHPREAVKAGLALVTEDRKRLGLFPQMTVRDNITVCTLREATAAGVVSARRERRAAEESIGLLGVKTDGPEANVMSLSGGNQQKCVIARWLRTNPKVLLLDDPTRGIDVGAKAEIYRVIDRLCRDGLGIVVTSSELPELMTLCDRILVLCEGRVTGEFARGGFNELAIMEAATDREAAKAG